jgi:hypothetical protein
MKDYEQMCFRKNRLSTAARQIGQIKRLVKMKLPADILLFLIVTVVYPNQVLPSIRR